MELVNDILALKQFTDNLFQRRQTKHNFSNLDVFLGGQLSLFHVLNHK